MRLARWTLALFVCLPVVTPNPARAWSTGVHWGETENNVLKSLGWKNPAAINRVTDANIATDLANGGIAGCAAAVYPNARQLKPDVLANANFKAPFNTKGTNGFHFDDMKNYTECKERWDALWQWMKDVRTYCEDQGWRAQDRDDYLVAMGMALHAVQDFYCHSNWVYRLNSLTPTVDYRSNEFPTWDELVIDYNGWRTDRPLRGAQMLDRMKESDAKVSAYEFNGGLQTGYWDHDRRTQPDGSWITPWYHRHHNEGWDFSGEKIRTCEIALALVASKQWVGWMIDLLSPANKQNLVDYINEEPAPAAFGRAALTSSPIDVAAGEALDTVFVTFAGPLQPVEYVNVHYHQSGKAQSVFLERDQQFLYSESMDDSLWTCSTLEVHVYADSVFDWIVASPDPYIAAQGYHAAGLFTMTRSNCFSPHNVPGPSSSRVGVVALMAGTMAPALAALWRRRRPPSVN